MPAPWTKRTVKDLLDKGEVDIKTGPFGTQLHASDYVEKGTPVINVRNIGFGDIRPENLEFITEDTVRRLSSHLLEAGDIVFGRKGAVERHAFVRLEEAGWLQGSDCLRVRFKSLSVQPRFLSYCFLSESHKRWMINQCSHGATMASLNQDIICRIPLRLPPIEIQKKIVGILSPYDDLMKNNSRRIKILEEVAQAIYRQWFVHFRFPGHKKVKLVSSPLGPIPTGWEARRATDAIAVDPPTHVPREGEKPFVPMSSLATDSMLALDIERRTGNSGSKFRNGDTLFARITPCLENGKTAFVQFLPTDEDVAFGSTEFIVLRSKTLSPEFVYLLARSADFRSNAIKSMSGASGRQRVQSACFDKFLLPHPDQKTLSAFAEQASPMFQAVQVLAAKNEDLRKTRDLLLPKLISGELDVSDLDVNVRDAAA